MRLIEFPTGLRQDVTHAFRSLRRSWGFTLLCLASLTIGLGINAAIVVLLRTTFGAPAAVRAEGAVELLVTTRDQVLNEAWSYPDFADVARANIGLELTAWRTSTRHLRSADGGDGAPLSTMYSSANYFATLGIGITHGRAFAAEEDDVVAEPPAVVSFDMWRNRLAADPNVVGRTLSLNGTVHRVIGVAPERYDGHHAGQRIDVWVPLWTDPSFGVRGEARLDRGADGVRVLGRLRDGVALAAANGALDGVMGELAAAYPVTNESRGAAIVPYSVQGGGSEESALVRIVFSGLSGLALLVVCLNLSGMVLARSATQERQLALRLALGAHRGRVVRYLLTESALIAFGGAVLSIAASAVVLRILSARVGQPFPAEHFLPVIPVCVGLSLVAVLAIGLSPALKFTRPAVMRAVKGDVGAGGRRSSRLHRFAVAAQVAMALPLLIVTGMVLEATRLMDDANYGFEPQGLHIAQLDLAAEGYTQERSESFLRDVRDAVGTLTGIESAALATAVPLDYVGRYRRLSRSGDVDYVFAERTIASERYFETIGTPILRGREFERADTLTAEPVAVITEALAERLWPGEEALGRRVQFASDAGSSPDLTIVGIAADVAGASADSEPLSIFVPLAQHPTTSVALVLRARSPAAAAAVRAAVLRLDPYLTPPLVRPAPELIAEQKSDVRTGAVLVGSLSGLTLLLAALGVYGVVAFAVANRTREIGTRIALGATALRIIAMVLLDGVKLAFPGMVVGGMLGILVSDLVLSGWYTYFDRDTLDPFILGVAAVGAIGVVLIACGVPARRAANLQPTVALRDG
jgi:predicted permease